MPNRRVPAPKGLISRLKTLWFSLEEPPEVTALMMVIYVVMIGVGLAAILAPPTALLSSWGQPLTMIWGSLLMVGGALGAAACPRGLWWLEAQATWILILALNLRALLVLMLQITTGSGSRITQLGELVALTLWFALRWARIRGIPVDPLRDREGHDADAA